MRETTILFKGKQSEKIINGNKYLVTPFAGVRDYIGIGIIIHNAAPRNLKDTKGNVISETNPVYHFEDHLMWPQDLAAVYRGMLMAQEMPEIKFGWGLGGTLQSCYEAAKDISWGKQWGYLKNIQSQIGGKQKLEEIMNSLLPSDEFDEAIRFLQEKERQFDVEPLIKELSRGTLQQTPTLEKLAANYAVQQIAKQQQYVSATK